MENLTLGPQVSIVIVNYNTTALTYACIQSVLAFTSISFEIILVDNASADRSIEQVGKDFPQVLVIFSEENIGFGRANNLAFAKARGKYLLLLNSDTLLKSDAITEFFNFMESPEHQHIACCGGSLITLEGNEQVSYGNFPSLAEAFASLGPGIFYKDYYKKHLSSAVKVYRKEPHRVDYISGADLFIRKAVLFETGFFDEDFFLYFEETELAYRMRKKGYELYILPNVEIVHLESSSPYPDEVSGKEMIFAASRVLFFKKCYGNIVASMAKWVYFLQKLIYRLKRKQTGK